MKAVILAGGLGTRMAELTDTVPKPMVEIGGRPIIWHIMKTFRHYGIKDFIICGGYKSEIIKKYFRDYQSIGSDLIVDLAKNTHRYIETVETEDWTVTIAETGSDTMTGGRLKRIKKYLTPGEDFFFTYGDGLTDANLHDLLKFHNLHGKMATVTAVRPTARFGELNLEQDSVIGFSEKPTGDNRWINGGYFVLNTAVLDLIEGDSTSWEVEPMNLLTQREQLMAFKHDGFWQPMDTLRENRQLNELWSCGTAPWRVW